MEDCQEGNDFPDGEDKTRLTAVLDKPTNLIIADLRLADISQDEELPSQQRCLNCLCTLCTGKTVGVACEAIYA